MELKSKGSFFEKLKKLCGTRDLIEVERSFEHVSSIEGYVVDLSPIFLVLQVVDENYRLNGYSVLTLRDIDRYRKNEEKNRMVNYVLSKRYGTNHLDRFLINDLDMRDFTFLNNVHNGVAPLSRTSYDKNDRRQHWCSNSTGEQ